MNINILNIMLDQKTGDNHFLSFALPENQKILRMHEKDWYSSEGGIGAILGQNSSVTRHSWPPPSIFKFLTILCDLCLVNRYRLYTSSLSSRIAATGYSFYSYWNDSFFLPDLPDIFSVIS